MGSSAAMKSMVKAGVATRKAELLTKLYDNGGITNEGKIAEDIIK